MVFVRDDQSRNRNHLLHCCFAIRDEVCDLETAGNQNSSKLTDAALRVEGLHNCSSPKWDEYLKWAVDAFCNFSFWSLKNKTQIHTTCVILEFNDIIAAIAKMDADVISVETSRSCTVYGYF